MVDAVTSKQTNFHTADGKYVSNKYCKYINSGMSERILSLKVGLRILWGHDMSVVLIEDGVPLFGAESERFERTKHGNKTFPEQTIRAALDRYGFTLDDIDRVVVPYDPDLEPLRFRRYYKHISDSSLPEYKKQTLLEEARTHLRQFSVHLLDEIRAALSTLDGAVPPIVTKPHHLCHAASAFYPSGFDDALVVSMDGFGECSSTVLWHGTDDGLEQIRAYEMPNSIGMFYATFTNYLGYRILNGEGKVMGLAPYGRENESIESAIRSVVETEVDYDVTGLTDGFHKDACLARLESVLERPATQTTDSFTQFEKDLAYTAQKLTEEIVLNIVEYGCRDLGVDQVAFAGGVALNCTLNQQISEHPAVEELFVQPVATDAGIALGATMSEFEPREIEKFAVPYFGPDYDVGQIADLLDRFGVPYSKPTDIERTVAKRLANGELIGRFAGRMEMGPRALGNRSILADPRDVSSRQRINDRVKNREAWRPFAPSILADRADEYLENACEAPYMIRTFDVKPEKVDEIPAVLHPANNTTRPQTVRRDQNPDYYQLIKAFEQLTDVPVLLNTSFNDHGEPIVNEPKQAIKDFFTMGLDTLVLEDLLVEKPAQL